MIKSICGAGCEPLGGTLLSSSSDILMSHPEPQGEGVIVYKPLGLPTTAHMRTCPFVCLFIHSTLV